MKSSHDVRDFLAIAALCIAIFIYQSQLPPVIQKSVLPDLSLELDVGSPEAASVDGPFYWVTKPRSRIVLANNTALSVKTTLKGVVSVSDCSYEATIKIKANGLELTGEIGPLQSSYPVDLLVSLLPYERHVIEMYVAARGCPTAPTDGRVILSKISGLTLLEYEK